MTSTWLGGTGSWNDPAGWSAGVPQDTSTDSFDAVIDGGNPVSSNVTLDSAAAVGSLHVDAGDALVVTPSGQLTLHGNQIENAGEITLQGTGTVSTPSLKLNAPNTVLSGGGSIRLDGGSFSLNGDAYNTLVNLDNRFSGWGAISDSGLFAFTNYGLIEADVPGKGLTVAEGINYGTMRAVGGGSLFLASGPNLINRGTVEALDGSQVASSDFFDSEGGTFVALNHSTMNLSGGHSGSLFVTDADSTISLYSDQDHGGLTDVTLDGQIYLSANVSGTITNLGSIAGLYSSSGTVYPAGLYPYGPTNVVNRGHIFLGYELPLGGASNSAVLSFSGGGTVTINSGDQFGGDLGGPIRNLDNEIRGFGTFAGLQQNGGSIEAEGGTLTIRNNASPVNHSGVFGAVLGGTLEMQAAATGPGDWRADGGVIHVTGDVETTGNIGILHGGSLSLDSTMAGRHLIVDDTGSLSIQGVLKIAGNVDFDGSNGGRWSFAPGASLEANGGHGAAVGDWNGWQSYEASGRDLGLVAAGFTNSNFYLPKLVIGSDGRLVLRDLHDNGNRTPGTREALYVDTLVFSDSLGLLDLNGIDLYFNNLVGSPNQIIDAAAPEPPGAVLLALATLSMGLSRRRRLDAC